MVSTPDDVGAEFVGRHFRVETPLEQQFYDERQDCLSRWVAAIPMEPSDGTLKEAVEKMGEVYQNWQTLLQGDFSAMHKWKGSGTGYQ